jgi:uncharacterized membrane protein YphA (DoxX/SURF4 family)
MNTALKPQWTVGRILLLLGRLALAGVLLYAVYAKLDNPPGAALSFDTFRWKLAVASFGIAIANYQLLPPSVTETVAYLVLGIELALGLWLLLGLGLRWSATASAALLGFFLALMLHAYSKGLTIDCGCFGPGDTIGPKTFARDGLLLALAIAVAVGAWLQHRKRRGALRLEQSVQSVQSA